MDGHTPESGGSCRISGHAPLARNDDALKGFFPEPWPQATPGKPRLFAQRSGIAGCTSTRHNSVTEGREGCHGFGGLPEPGVPP